MSRAVPTHMARPNSAAVVCSLLLSTCAAPPAAVAPALEHAEPRASPVSAPTPTARRIDGPASHHEELAHDLAISSIACWMGGIWSEAEGVADDARAADTERRCRFLLRRVYGGNDQARYERMRALDSVEVFELKEAIIARAREAGVEPARQYEMAGLVASVADAEREAALARWAGDRVKLHGDGEHESKLVHFTNVAPLLSESRAFEALLHEDLGELTHEVRTVAILSALERLETTCALPRHLKLYAVSRPFETLFGVPAPAAPAFARMQPNPDAWIAYLTATAAAASHPVPDSARSLLDRELLAWGGTLAGLSDKLLGEAETLPEGELKNVSEAIAQRLYVEYRTTEAAVKSEKASLVRSDVLCGSAEPGRLMHVTAGTPPEETECDD